MFVLNLVFFSLHIVFFLKKKIKTSWLSDYKYLWKSEQEVKKRNNNFFNI
jgi:hypothetical protein